MALSIEQQLALRHVEAYDLPTFLQGVEQAVKDGYQISLEHNETYPYGTIGHYIVKMIKQEPKKVNLDKLTINLKVDTTEVQKVVDESIEALKTLKVVAESTPEGVGSQDENKETVEAPKKVGRKAKSE